jgi:hypothetical protein
MIGSYQGQAFMPNLGASERVPGVYGAEKVEQFCPAEILFRYPLD